MFVTKAYNKLSDLNSRTYNHISCRWNNKIITSRGQELKKGTKSKRMKSSKSHPKNLKPMTGYWIYILDFIFYRFYKTGYECHYNNILNFRVKDNSAIAVYITNEIIIHRHCAVIIAGVSVIGYSLHLAVFVTLCSCSFTILSVSINL